MLSVTICDVKRSFTSPHRTVALGSRRICCLLAHHCFSQRPQFCASVCFERWQQQVSTACCCEGGNSPCDAVGEQTDRTLRWQPSPSFSRRILRLGRSPRFEEQSVPRHRSETTGELVQSSAEQGKEKVGREDRRRGAAATAHWWRARHRQLSRVAQDRISSILAPRRLKSENVGFF